MRRARPLWRWFAVVGLLLGGVGRVVAAGGEEPGLQALLDERRDRGSSEWVVRQLEQRLSRGHRDAATVEALLRARYSLAVYWLREVDAAAAERQLHRAIEQGVRWLAGEAGRNWASYDEIDAERDRIGRAAIGVYYWTTLCYGAAIPSRSVFSRMAAAKRFRRGLERLVQLDRGFFHGGPDRVLGEFLHRAPGLVGGDARAAKRYARRAREEHPAYIENVVIEAIVVIRPERGDEAYAAALRRALDMPVDALPDCVPEQRAARRRARRLLDELR